MPNAQSDPGEKTKLGRLDLEVLAGQGVSRPGGIIAAAAIEWALAAAAANHARVGPGAKVSSTVVGSGQQDVVEFDIHPPVRDDVRLDLMFRAGRAIHATLDDLDTSGELGDIVADAYKDTQLS